MTDINALLDSAPENLRIVDSLLKTRSVLGRCLKCAVSVSGGASYEYRRRYAEFKSKGNNPVKEQK